MADNGFGFHSAGLSDPFLHTVDIDAQKSDTVALTNPVRSFYVTVGGAVKFITVGGETDTWTIADKTMVPIAVKQVFSTGTTATGIKGGW